MEDELSGKIVTKFVRLRAKFYSYWTGDGNYEKKAKGAKKCVMKRKVCHQFEIIWYILKNLKAFKSNSTWE